MWQIIVVILGLVFGAFLNKRVKEEVKQGKKYFIFFERLILLVLVLLFIKLDILLLIGILIGLVICRFFKRIYFYFGILIGAAKGELFLASICLVFLFGLIYGSLSKFKLKNLILDVVVFLIPFSFLFMETFINGNLSILIGVGIGGIIQWARGSAW